MGDVADILGMNKHASSSQDDAARILGEKPKSSSKIKSKPKGMSRELFALVGEDGIAPAVQTNQGPLFKDKRQNAMKGKWVWAPFRNSARSDNLELCHWIKSEQQGFDYPYAKFNVKLEPIQYTDAEYESMLQSALWTRSETDHLMYLCHRYDLRWPVIADRYEPTPPRTTEELMARYYFIVSKLKAQHSGQGEFSNRHQPCSVFNAEYERARRKQQDILFHQTFAQVEEEAKLREELKAVDAALKKIKKQPKQPSTSAAATAAAEAAARNAAAFNASMGQSQPGSASNLVPPIMMYGGGISDPSGRGLKPSPGNPCLQSARLALHSEQNQKVLNPDMSKSFMKKLVLYLQEQGMPDRLLPTRAVCDLNDQVRRNAATLLSLQNTLAKKEKDLVTLRATYESGSRSKKNSGAGFVIPHASVLIDSSDKELTEHYVKPTVAAVLPPPLPVSQGRQPSSKAGTKKTEKRTQKRKASAISEGDNATDGAGESKSSSSSKSSKKTEAAESASTAAAGSQAVKEEATAASKTTKKSKKQKVSS
mmetsp:Transcript_22673/g.33138  ORF Transcript_22673/g.33138 Transcript_22673/m.33138 type:complete len:538 (+) Transcript_22673:120-1733(+)